MPVIQFKGRTAVESYHRVAPHHTLEVDAKVSVLDKGRKPALDGNLIKRATISSRSRACCPRMPDG